MPPYKSDAQRKFAHTATAKKKGFPTKEFDEASKGMKLPKKVGAKSTKSNLSKEEKEMVKRMKGHM